VDVGLKQTGRKCSIVAHPGSMRQAQA
jgi:hypothetical protein